MGSIKLEVRSEKGVLKATLLDDFALRILSDLVKSDSIKKVTKNFTDNTSKDCYIITKPCVINCRIMEIMLFEDCYVRFD